MEQFIRTEMLIGTKNLKNLATKTIMVFGCGGVGSFVIEALVRTGIQKLIIIDNDTISFSNLNRQIIALHSNLGEYKVDVMKKRLLDINPNLDIKTHQIFVLPNTINDISFDNVDYIVDCIDTISGKLAIIEAAKKYQIEIISCMGTGNKLDPTTLRITDISNTHTCPLAKVMRRELRKRKIAHLNVLFSTELPLEVKIKKQENINKQTPGSVIFVPSVAGLLIARKVIIDLLEEKMAT